MKSGSIAIVTTPSGSAAGLYQECSVASAFLKNVPMNSKVTVVADEGLWAKVKYDARVGYIMTVFLVPVETEESSFSGVDFDEEKIVGNKELPLEKRVEMLERKIAELEKKLARLT